MSKQPSQNAEQKGTELSDEHLEHASGGAELQTRDEPSLTDEPPTEEVAFYYNKIAFQYVRTTDGKK